MRLVVTVDTNSPVFDRSGSAVTSHPTTKSKSFDETATLQDVARWVGSLKAVQRSVKRVSITIDDGNWW